MPISVCGIAKLEKAIARQKAPRLRQAKKNENNKVTLSNTLEDGHRHYQYHGFHLLIMPSLRQLHLHEQTHEFSEIPHLPRAKHTEDPLIHTHPI